LFSLTLLIMNNQGYFRLNRFMCLFLAYSWVKIPWLVEMTKWPNCLEGRTEFVHFSKSVTVRSYLGEMTPTLLILPKSSMTIFFDLWSSTISNSPMYPCFCMILKNLSKTFEAGLIKTCFFPFLSALTMVLKQSARMLALVILWIIKNKYLMLIFYLTKTFLSFILPFTQSIHLFSLQFTLTSWFTGYMAFRFFISIMRNNKKF